MSIVLSLLAQLLHIALMLAVAPTLAGLTDWLGARFAGRDGPPILLPWRDLVRLSRKAPLSVECVSVVSRLAPAAGVGATLAAAALVPSFTLGMALSPLADVLVIVSLLSVARVAGLLAALDSGIAISGAMAQRNNALAVLAEPVLMLSMVALALIAGSFNLDLIIAQQREGLLLPATASPIVLAALLGLFAADGSGTSEAMFSGTDLALARMSGWLRRLVWLDLISGVFLPIGMQSADDGPVLWLIGLAAWVLKLSLFALGLSALETFLGRVPRHRLPDLIGVAALLALLAIIMVLASAGMA